MTWVLIILGIWLAAAVVVALAVGRTVHEADVIEHTGDGAEPVPQRRADDAPPSSGLAGFVAPTSPGVFADR